jgi:hypothetical protein
VVVVVGAAVVVVTLWLREDVGAVWLMVVVGDATAANVVVVAEDNMVDDVGVMAPVAVGSEW